ncbi:Retrovirus-related Pol polyprotein from transposon RE1 [Dictyocoela muelleri]|nr:Retrovirus-related Pol polyprotein from transposon RE1 [Dictyocoela muelleri]
MDHVGIKSTFNRICEKYIGINLNDVRKFVETCVNCQRESLPNLQRSITLIIPDYVRERLIVDTIDITFYRHNNNDYRYIFTFFDSFSKYAWAYPARNKNGETFLSILRYHFYFEGTWAKLHSDNGGEFFNRATLEVLSEFNIEFVVFDLIIPSHRV